MKTTLRRVTLAQTSTAVHSFLPAHRAEPSTAVVLSDGKDAADESISAGSLARQKGDWRITPATPYELLPEYLTVAELQHYLSIGRSAAYDFARRRGVKIGRLRRVPKSALPQLGLEQAA